MLGCGPHPIVVSNEPDVRAMAAYLLSVNRENAAIGLTTSESGERDSLNPSDVRKIVGNGPRIYLLTARCLPALQELLGARLTLRTDAARIW